MAERISIGFQQVEGGWTPYLSVMGDEWLRVSPAFRVCFLNGQDCDGGYSALYDRKDKWVASGVIVSPDGSRVEVTDTWSLVDDSTAQVDRTVKVGTAGNSPGIRVEFFCETAVPEAGTLDDWEFCVPGALYKKNDTDHDGAEDYLGTYIQDYRDDRLPSLAVLAYLSRLRAFVVLARCTRPAYDTSINSDQLLGRRFVQNTDIGSIGLEPVRRASVQILFRASYPFSERFSYCLNTNRDGWAAYRENQGGAEFRVSYRLTVGRADSLTDAIWNITKRQMATLQTAPQKLHFSLEESLDYRLALTQLYYRKWDKSENPKEPAGYMVHFSPRSGRTQGTLLEYGFCGAQTLLAYVSLRYGYLKQIPLWIERARTVIEFFVNHCQLENGFSQGIYDVAKQEFVYWFTGILLPFQYAHDDASLRRFLGSQMTKSLAPIARELRVIKGNYTRTMCESIYPILLAYRAERKNGRMQAHWLASGERFGAFLLRAQAEDGSWFRAYDSSGNGLETPAAWFGFSNIEKKSGTIFPIEVLIELYNITGNPRYVEAAEKAGDFIIRNYVDKVQYVGGLNDTTHIKSVKIDSVGVMFVVRSLVKLYEVTRKQEHLDGAVKSAKILASWVYLWNVPFPHDSLLAKAGFNSTGWAVCDVIPGGSYLDNEFLEFTGDFIRVAQYSGEKALFDVAELVEYGMQQALSTPECMLGYVAPGIQCEGIMTAYWMSDPEQTEFSGAANKVKGQDNDTCNGLINGQAAYGLFDLQDKYRTTDLDSIWRYLFKG
jgi:hypothetical protein